jgi:hypothetical protein
MIDVDVEAGFFEVVRDVDVGAFSPGMTNVAATCDRPTELCATMVIRYLAPFIKSLSFTVVTDGLTVISTFIRFGSDIAMPLAATEEGLAVMVYPVRADPPSDFGLDQPICAALRSGAAARFGGDSGGRLGSVTVVDGLPVSAKASPLAARTESTGSTAFA